MHEKVNKDLLAIYQQFNFKLIFFIDLLLLYFPINDLHELIFNISEYNLLIIIIGLIIDSIILWKIYIDIKYYKYIKNKHKLKYNKKNK